MTTTSSLDYSAVAAVGLKLTKHARTRMIERHIDGAELVAAVTEDNSTRVTDAQGVTVFGSNGVALVLDRAMTLIVTVLPRGTVPTRWRGRDEGLRGYRRDPSTPRNRSQRRSTTRRRPTTRASVIA